MKRISDFLSLGIFVFFSLFCIFGFKQTTPALQGRWSILTTDGKPSGELVNFIKDHSYTVSLPDGTIGEKGEYSLTGPLLSIKNIKDVCGKNYWGKYNLTFYGTDSVHFSLIADSCTERRRDMIGYNPGLKRFKKR